MTSSLSDLVAAHVKSARRRQRLTAQELAAKCTAIGASHLTAAVIANIETGRRDANNLRRRDVTVDELCAFALALDMQPVDLLGSRDGYPVVQITSEVLAAPADMAAWVKGTSTGLAPSLLGGIALCGACQAALLAHTTPKGMAYFCANDSCPGPRINRLAKFIDRYISALIFERLSDPESMEILIAPEDREEEERAVNAEVATWDEEIADVKRRRAQAQRELEDLANHPQLSAEVLARSLASFDQKILELDILRTEAKRKALLMRYRGIVKTGLDNALLSERRNIVKLLINVTLVAAPEGENADQRAAGEGHFCPDDVLFWWNPVS